jgi:hypothetical protein
MNFRADGQNLPQQAACSALAAIAEEFILWA